MSDDQIPTNPFSTSIFNSNRKPIFTIFIEGIAFTTAASFCLSYLVLSTIFGNWGLPLTLFSSGDIVIYGLAFFEPAAIVVVATIFWHEFTNRKSKDDKDFIVEMISMFLFAATSFINSEWAASLFEYYFGLNLCIFIRLTLMSVGFYAFFRIDDSELFGKILKILLFSSAIFTFYNTLIRTNINSNIEYGISRNSFADISYNGDNCKSQVVWIGERATISACLSGKLTGWWIQQPDGLPTLHQDFTKKTKEPFWIRDPNPLKQSPFTNQTSH